jgi:hypothetical protein
VSSRTTPTEKASDAATTEGVARDIEICTEVEPPEEKRAEAEAAALEERADNLQGRTVRTEGPVARMAVEVQKRWGPGKRLKIRFLDGDPSVQERVVNFAKQWEQHANIKLDFGTHSDAEVRISFTREGSWSAVGTDVRFFRASEPTMNYGWLTPSSTDAEYSRVVLHEFGHALGAIHEHQSPGAEVIPWDEEAVYAYYARQGWSRAQVDRNIFNRYSETTTNFSEFDRSSIMLYAIPDELTEGTYSVGWNRVLSVTDKSFMKSTYPFDEPEVVELAVAGPRASAEIGSDGEIDRFAFTVDTHIRHIITTEGPTNVVMTLLGPDDEALLVAADDDSGKATNARIVRKLRPGQYWLRVNHFLPTGSGAYTVGVRKAAR